MARDLFSLMIMQLKSHAYLFKADEEEEHEEAKMSTVSAGFACVASVHRYESLL